MTIRYRWAIAAALVACAAAIAAWPQFGGPRVPKLWDVEIVASFPHDPAAFTQGLVFHDGALYEGTGLYGSSSLREVDVATGEVERQVTLPGRYFGEGIAVLGDRLYQLTWQKQTGFVYEVDSFEQVGSFSYSGEGWGLTHDGEHLIMSDGSESLRFLDPDSFDVVRTIRVRDEGRPVVRLNELEYIDGEIWANVWYDDRIARISPDSGEVVGWIDATAVYPSASRRRDHVLNGIAYDAASGRVFITGKNWPKLYEIVVVPR
ncbi:MAG: glutaminyl-peptide cyclotransferase [Gammaproteobacteria bacterium]|nr:glutaminyl-peptide cyclotransferase [Gammaproteobacteria bacterium]